MQWSAKPGISASVHPGISTSMHPGIYVDTGYTPFGLYPSSTAAGI